MKTHKIHPACAASPTMSAERYKSFKADIAEHGVIDPIILFRGQIIDGRHRQMVCDELGIEPEYMDDDLVEHQGDPWAFVYSRMMRKEVTEGPLAMFAAEYQKTIKKPKGRPKKKPRNGAELSIGESDKQAAQRYGISARTVNKAANVLDKGCPQLQQSVRSDRINVSLAEKICKQIDDVDEQAEVVAVAMVQEKPEKALRDELAKRSQTPQFDEDRERDRVMDYLRGRFNSWPANKRGVLIHMIESVLLEYKK